MLKNNTGFNKYVLLTTNEMIEQINIELSDLKNRFQLYEFTTNKGWSKKINIQNRWFLKYTLPTRLIIVQFVYLICLEEIKNNCSKDSKEELIAIIQNKLNELILGQIDDIDNIIKVNENSKETENEEKLITRVKNEIRVFFESYFNDKHICQTIKRWEIVLNSNSKTHPEVIPKGDKKNFVLKYKKVKSIMPGIRIGVLFEENQETFKIHAISPKKGKK